MTPADLRAWRTTRGLTLDEMAAKLGVGRMTVWKWEQGTHATPPMLDLALWALEHGAPQPNSVS